MTDLRRPAPEPRVDVPDPNACPDVSLALLRYLEQAFPLDPPMPGDSHDELMFRSGQNAVVRFLRAWHERQHAQT